MKRRLYVVIVFRLRSGCRVLLIRSSSVLTQEYVQLWVSEKKKLREKKNVPLLLPREKNFNIISVRGEKRRRLRCLVSSYLQGLDSGVVHEPNFFLLLLLPSHFPFWYYRRLLSQVKFQSSSSSEVTGIV